MDIENLTPENLANELKKDIIGQDQYIKDLSTALWMHYLQYDHFKQTGTHLESPKTNILVIGKSGSGKTLAIETLAKKILNLPLVIENASLLTGAGWKGNSVDTLALRAVAAAGGDEDLEKYAIIALDECDKLFGSNRVKDTSFSPVANLLTFIGGSMVTFEKGNDKITVDTSHMLFIFMGAFAGLEEIIKERINGKSCIGFGTAASSKEPLPEKNIFKLTQHMDLHKYGIPWELLGRIQTITSMEELTVDDYENILLHSASSIIKKYCDLFSKSLGVYVGITSTAAHYIAQKAKDNEMGARGLNQIVAEMLQPAIYELGSDTTINRLHFNVCDGELIVERIHGERADGYDRLTIDDRIVLESVPFSCIRGMSDIWLYAKKIQDHSKITGRLTMDMVLAAKYILAAAISLMLMQKDEYTPMTMDMLFYTLNDMSPDGIPERIYPLADMYNNCVKKANSYGIDFNQVKRTAENILLAYSENYFMEMENPVESTYTDAG